ncbi:hypothetical protein HW115_08490 [Verrucomicrobiaceae bacterium N1E253]|uniref:Uncharacterized protein n=1 Tax=Oceaniferula marina TaxID=2748318 RepID=A0A851GKN0_9BACT|nr:hypothetical protein [Oceaniferula marina]NWK55647.1 hypothetical protein [Oceaniferula marina]
MKPSSSNIEKDKGGRGGESPPHRKINLPSPSDLRSGQTSWERLSNTQSENRCGTDISERWYDKTTGMSIGITGNTISSVQANLSRLLTGNDHNGIIVCSQEQIDKALDVMWDALDLISNGPRTCKFTSVEFGGVIATPYSQLELLVKDRNLPGLHKAPLLRSGESIQFGAAKRPPLCLHIYDKGQQMAGKSFREKWTRIELKLSADKLKDHIGDGDNVTELVYDNWVECFFKILYSLDPDDTGKVPLVDDNFVQMLAAMKQHPDLLMNGAHPVDLYLSKVSPDRASRIKKAMAVLHMRELSLRDLVPNDPMPEPIDLIKTATGIERADKIKTNPQIK